MRRRGPSGAPRVRALQPSVRYLVAQNWRFSEEARLGDKKLTTSDIIILAAGAVMLICLFLPWLDLGFEDKNAFGQLVFPLGTFACLFGILMALQVLLTKVASMSFPERILDFTWDQIHVVLSIFAALLMVSWLIVDVGGADKKIGLWLALLAAIALVVGAVLRLQESPSTAAGPGTTPPTPF
jgi:hypothetical protein